MLTCVGQGRKTHQWGDWALYKNISVPYASLIILTPQEQDDSSHQIELTGSPGNYVSSGRDFPSQ